MIKVFKEELNKSLKEILENTNKQLQELNNSPKESQENANSWRSQRKLFKT